MVRVKSLPPGVPLPITIDTVAASGAPPNGLGKLTAIASVASVSQTLPTGDMIAVTYPVALPNILASTANIVLSCAATSARRSELIGRPNQWVDLANPLNSQSRT